MKAILFSLTLLIAQVNAMQEEKQRLKAEDYKVLSLNITLYRDQNFDSDGWKECFEHIDNYNDAPFSITDLNATLLHLYVISKQKKGIWGGVSKTYLKDAEKIDGPKKT